MSTIELLFDGDIRGYRTGKDCVLELMNHPLWKDSIKLNATEEHIIKTEQENYLEIVDHVVDNACATLEGKKWSLCWIEGSIFAIREDHVFEEE